MQRSEWENFIKGNEDILRRLPDKIATSWHICYQKNVDPYMVKPKEHVSIMELTTRQNQNQALIRLAQKEVLAYNRTGVPSSFLYVLTDQEGTILWRKGDETLQKYANHIGFKEGSNWSESAAGTNAIGLALRTEDSEFISLEEHYAMGSKNWSCAAAPIFNEKHQVIGILNVSAYQNDSAREALLQVKMMAQSIGNQCYQMKLNREKALLQYIQIHSNQKIICDTDFQIMYLAPEYLKQFSLNQDIRHYIDNGQNFEKEEIYHQEQLIGYRFLPNDTTKKISRSRSLRYQAFLKQAHDYANSELPVHIYGESGSGKEGIAKLVHDNSPYCNGPLVTINCGAMSETLLESELFGYAPGAFTGANSQGYQGKIAQANGGTLFLDEVDSMPKKMQNALLRVLEEKIVTPISGQSQKVDFRLITASNQTLKKKVIEKQFREDLFYRLFVCVLEVPALRERFEDLPQLIKTFCQKKDWQVSDEERIIEVASAYDWPGNIREFNNFLERLYLTKRVGAPSKKELESLIVSGSLYGNLQKEIESNKEKERIEKALEQHHYHLVKTAESLGISRTTLYRRMKEYNI